MMVNLRKDRKGHFRNTLQLGRSYPRILDIEIGQWLRPLKS